MAEYWALLPSWVRAGPFVAAAIHGLGTGWLVVAVVGFVTTFPLRRLPPDAPWYERARLAWPARQVGSFSAVVAIVSAGLLWANAELLPAPTSVFVVLAGVMAVAGAWLAGRGRDRLVWGEQPRPPVGDALITAFCFRPSLLVVVVVNLATTAQFDRWTVTVIGLGVVALLLGMRGDHLDILRVIGRSGPASERLARATEAATTGAGARALEVDEVRVHHANAAAFPLARRVFATRALVEGLTDRQISAVMAHELAHIDEPGHVRALRVAAGLSLLVPLLAAHPLFGLGGLWLAGALGLGLGLAVVLGRVARRMEERADAAAVAHAGTEGEFAQALEAIYRLNLVPAVLPGRGAAHPHLYDRMVSAGVTPEWPRPAPPARIVGILGVGVMTIVTFGVAMGFFALGAVSAMAGGSGAELRLGLGVGRPWDLTEIARERVSVDPAAAARLYAAAAELSPESPWEPANLAIVLAGMGRCEDAARAAREARQRDKWAPDGGSEAVAELFGSMQEAVRTCFEARRPTGADLGAGAAAAPPAP